MISSSISFRHSCKHNFWHDVQPKSPFLVHNHIKPYQSASASSGNIRCSCWCSLLSVYFDCTSIVMRSVVVSSLLQLGREWNAQTIAQLLVGPRRPSSLIVIDAEHEVPLKRTMHGTAAFDHK